MTTTLHPSFPGAETAVADLVNAHLRLTDEPLLLAIYYAPERDEQDIFLFELIEGFGAESVDEDRKLFEVTYANRDAFPMAPGQTLHMVLTSPTEFEAAVRENWVGIIELRDAITRGACKVHYESPGHPDFLRQLTHE